MAADKISEVRSSLLKAVERLCEINTQGICLNVFNVIS